MCKVHSLSQLDRHIIDHLNVGTRHIDRQIKIQPFYMLEDVPTVVVFGHGEMGTAQFVSEAVEGGRDVGVRLNVDPPGDVLFVRDLPNDELLAEVFVVDHVRRVADNVLHLYCCHIVKSQFKIVFK